MGQLTLELGQMQYEQTGALKVRRIAIVAADGISFFHLAVPCMVFQDAFLDAPCFEVLVCSVSPTGMATKSGYQIELESNLHMLESADLVIISGWGDDLPEPPQWLLEQLALAHQRGATLVGLCLGAFVLASTGLLDGQPATTHWAYAEAFQHQFPLVAFDPQPLFIDNGRLITSAGIAASIDCCLHILRRCVGSERANQVARTMVTAPFRFGGQQQYVPTPFQQEPKRDADLNQVMDGIARNLASPHTIDSVAERCAMSRRTFTRKFKAAYGCSFGDWLLNQRLNASQQLLEKSHYSIAQIASRTGFGSESVYRKQFKQAFDLSPSQWRASFTGQIN